MPLSALLNRKATVGSPAEASPPGTLGSGASAPKGRFSTLRWASGSASRRLSAASGGLTAGETLRRPSREHYLSATTLQSLPAELAPNVPAQRQHTPIQQQYTDGIGPSAHNWRLALSVRGEQPTPNVGGSATTPIVSSGAFSPLLPPRVYLPDRAPPRQSLLPILLAEDAARDEQLHDRGGPMDREDGTEGEWETVASGPVAGASSLVPPVPCSPQYRQAGSSLADNSSLGELSVSGEPCRMRIPLRPLSRVPSSARSSGRVSGPLAGELPADVPHLSSGPATPVGQADDGALGNGAGAEWIRPARVESQSSCVRRDDEGGIRRWSGPFSFATSSIRFVDPPREASTNPSHREAFTADEWEDVTDLLGVQPSGVAMASPQAHRVDNVWRRNVRRLVARQREVLGESYLAPGSLGRPMALDTLTRDRCSVSRRECSPPSLPAASKVALGPTAPVPGSPATPPHTLLQPEDDRDPEAGPNLYNWSHMNLFPPLAARPVPAVMPRHQAIMWRRSMDLGRRCPRQIVAMYALVMTMMAVALAIALVVTARQRRW